MKILNLCGYSWEIGGPSKVIHDHAEIQTRLGAEVSIFTPLSPNENLYPVPKGVLIETFPRHKLARFIPEFSPELLKRYRQVADNYDIVHLHGAFHFAGWIPFLASSRPKKVFTLHGTLDSWALKKSASKKKIIQIAFQSKIISACDLVQVHNPDEAEDLKRFIGKTHPNVAMINNGMPLGMFDHLPQKGQFRARLGISDDQPLILFLSRINIKKGLNLLLPAFKQLLTSYPDAHLAIVGPDDGYLHWVQSFIANELPKSNVTYVGMLTGNEKFEALVDANVYAQPTYSESFSLATLEAMMCGTPTLTTNRIGFGHFLRDFPAAEVVDTTIDAVSVGLLKILGNKDYQQKLRLDGPKFVRKYADIEVVAKNLYHRFEDLLA